MDNVLMALFLGIPLIEMPIMMPGMKPPTNMSPIETSPMTPKTTMVIEGGITMPTTPLDATTPVAHSRP